MYRYSNCTSGLSWVRSDWSMKSLFLEENCNVSKFETVAEGMDKIDVIYHNTLLCM